MDTSDSMGAVIRCSCGFGLMAAVWPKLPSGGRHALKFYTYHRSVGIARPAAEVFAWHERSGAFERLQPPWEKVEVISRQGGIQDGARVTLRARVGPLWSRWEVEHLDYVEGVQFRDRQLRGPFAHWEHLHRIVPDGPGACVLMDEITYALPLGAAGRVASGFVRNKLDRLFAYRHAITKTDLERAVASSSHPRLRVLVSGASGLVGSALVPYLRSLDHEVVRLVRRKPALPDEVFWNPEDAHADFTAAGAIDAVVHLAGAGIADGRWTQARREKIRASRVEGTRNLVHGLLRMKKKPGVLISSSAVGAYGDCGDRVVDEDTLPGSGFLADVCRTWEAELVPAEAAGIRTLPLRLGLVLSPAGGALRRMLPAFRAGVAGPLGSGRQWMSWISMDDLLDIIHRGLGDAEWHGVINAVAPEPCRNAEFTRILAGTLRRPAFLPVPSVVLRLLFGHMADETLLASTRVESRRLTAAGYDFRHPTLQEALGHVLSKEPVVI